MTLNGVMALILRYFTEFGSFRGSLRKSYIEDVVVKQFTFAISSPAEFLVITVHCVFSINKLIVMKPVVRNSLLERLILPAV